MAKYPELNGAPSRCLNTSPMTVDALKIRAPFGKVDTAEVLQPAIVSMDWSDVDGVSAWELFSKFWQKKSQDPDVGWQSGAELKVLDKLRRLANNLIDRQSKYEAKSKPKIVSLAKAAKVQLNFIAHEYTIWDGKGFPGKANYGIQSLSLYRTEAEIKAALDPDYNAGLIWPSQRREARKQIRKAWDKVLRFLWCAVYAANQSKAYLRNQEIGMEGVTITAKRATVDGVKIAPKRLKVSLIPATQEPDFTPGMPMPEEEEIVEEEIVEPVKPKKKKGMGIAIAAAAAVALLALKR